MEPGAALARTVEESDDEGGDLESVHAGVDHGQEDDPGEELSGNVLDRVTRERGDVAAAFADERRDRRGHLPDAVGLPGLHRAAGLHGLARAVRHARRLDEHAGLVRHEERARTRLRPAARGHPRDRRAARRRLRRQVRARRAARGRGGTRASASRAARLHAQRGLPGDEPGLGAGDAPQGRRPQGRHVHGDRGPHDRRSRLERRLGRRGHHARCSSPGRTAGRLTTSGATACRRTASRSAPTVPPERRPQRSRSSRCSTSSRRSSGSTRSRCV